jgi:Carboxypeptidase regulatory-like domain
MNRHATPYKIKEEAMRKAVHVAFVCCLLLGVAQVALAQNTNSGDIRGTVTDVSGALIQGVNVTVTNNATGVINKFVTNSNGLYDTNSILPGNYTIEFSKEGFATFKRGPIPLQVGIVTVDATLKVGSSTEVVEVTSTAPLLKTEDAEVSTTLSTKQLTDLPSVDPRNGWLSLMKLLPGATSAPGGNGGDANPGVGQAIAGTMPFFSSYLVDGGSIWLPHSANIDEGQGETIAEVNVISSTASAQYGGGGNVFNLISKSGTNQFHGDAYDYFQNDDLDARNYFNRPPQAKGKQRYNYFGGAVGGPILKNKLFFYFNYQELINPNTSISQATVPTDAMKAGCFDPTIFGSGLTLDAAHGGTPLTTNPAQCGAFNPADLAIPTADFDPVAVNIQKDYVTATNQNSLTNNYSFLNRGTNPDQKYFGRLDYDMSAKNRINITVLMHQTPRQEFYSAVCPINCEFHANEGYSAQVTDVYTINSSMVNEFRYSFVRQANWFVPATLGLGYPAKLGLQFSQVDEYPSVNIGGTGGNSTLGPATNAVFIENTFVPSDVLTVVRGKHILHFGAELMFEQDNSTPWGNLNGATLGFTGQYTNGNVGYADFLLGDVQSWSTLSEPEHGMRAKNPSFFAQDDIKLRPNLTVNLGLRAEVHGGMSDVKNQIGGFDPTLTNPVTNTLGSIWFGGLNGARTQSFQTKTKLMPRLGIAWQPTDNWVVRGGVGQYSSLWSMDTVGGPLGFGTATLGSASANPGQAPVVQLSGTGAGLPLVLGPDRNPADYITPATPQGGGLIPYTPYNLPVMNGWQWTAGVQRRLPANMVVEAQYVGSHWNNLHFEADINQVPAGSLLQEGPPSNTPAQNLRPFPQFSGIGPGAGGARTGLYTGISNYRAVQFILKKPFSYGLSADVSFTWSQLKDDMDSSGWGNQFGGVYYQDAYTPTANYAVSNFDRPKSFKGSLVYAIPLGKGHQYLSSRVADEVLGGWQASTSFVAESGAPITVVMNNATNSGALDGSWYPNLVGNPHVSNQSINQWFNQLAYATPAPLTFGNNPRNSLRGPDLTDVDFSLAKTFNMPGWEQGKLQLRMDATNVLNHPSFNLPNNNLNPAALASGIPDPSVGQITSTTIPGRVVQVSARFSF